MKENPAEADKTLATCVYIIVNTAQLLHPFLPYSTKRVQEMLRIKELKWEEIIELPEQVEKVSPLFERIDKGRIEEEEQKLVRQSGLN